MSISNRNRWLSVSEAADRLDVHPTRIHALLRAGELLGEMRGRWEIEPASIDRWARVPRASGRPFDPAHAWAYLAEADQRRSLAAQPISRNERWRLAQQLRRGLPASAPRLRRRAEVLRGKVHPSLREKLSDELVASGAAAATEDLADRIIGEDRLEGYIRASRGRELLSNAVVVPDPDGAVVLHLVPDEVWPFEPGAKVVPPIVAALDLVESGDERARRLGDALLSSSQT